MQGETKIHMSQFRNCETNGSADIKLWWREGAVVGFPSCRLEIALLFPLEQRISRNCKILISFRFPELLDNSGV
jgi:hypothetical protein